MNEVVTVSKENQSKVQTLITRTNTVIQKLNKLAEQSIDIENQQTTIIVDGQKLKRTIILTKTLLKEIEQLIDEERSLRQSIRHISKIHFLKIRNLNAKIAEIATTIKVKESQLEELKKEQQKLSISVSSAKHKIARLFHSPSIYQKVVQTEYNPLIKNLNALTGLELETIDDDKIIILSPITINELNINCEVNTDEVVYE